MLEYQIRKYWLKAIYDQKTVKESTSLPRSWKCSSVTAPVRRPVPLSTAKMSTTTLTLARALDAK